MGPPKTYEKEVSPHGDFDHLLENLQAWPNVDLDKFADRLHYRYRRRQWGARANGLQLNGYNLQAWKRSIILVCEEESRTPGKKPLVNNSDFANHINGPISSDLKNWFALDHNGSWRWKWDDRRVVGIIVDHICPHFFLRRLLPLPSKTLLTAFDLVQYLGECSAEVCRLPFRILDLPRELRDHVYAESFLNPWDGEQHTLSTSVILSPGSIQHSKIPHLLQVNQQIRAESAEVFFTNTRISFRFDLRDYRNPRAIESAEDDMEPHDFDPFLQIGRAFPQEFHKHFRDIKVSFRWSLKHGDPTTIHVKWSPTHGLQVEFDAEERKKHDKPGNTSRENAYVTDVRARAEAEGLQGSSILKLFTQNLDGLRRAYYGPASKWARSKRRSKFMTFLRDDPSFDAPDVVDDLW